VIPTFAADGKSKEQQLAAAGLSTSTANRYEEFSDQTDAQSDAQTDRGFRQAQLTATKN
jgi:hypothetical protein